MNILILLGSPHKDGTTKALADKFAEGAKSVGHEVNELYLHGMDIAPCMGCNSCKRNEEQCCLKDDMEQVKILVKDADLVVFVSPLYYFGFTAQLKKAIDRFYAFNADLRKNPKKAVLISAGADDDDWAMDGIRVNYEVMCRYLHWKNVGEVLALGSASIEALEGKEYLKQAYDLGAAL
ncbi:MAG: flavodoxin family protein [Dorea sp.]